MRPFHEAEARFRAPETRPDFRDVDAVARGNPWHREDFHAQHEQVLVPARGYA